MNLLKPLLIYFGREKVIIPLNRHGFFNFQRGQTAKIRGQESVQSFIHADFNARLKYLRSKERCFHLACHVNIQKWGQLWRPSSKPFKAYKSSHVLKILHRSLNKTGAFQEARHIEISTHHQRHEGNLSLTFWRNKFIAGVEQHTALSTFWQRSNKSGNVFSDFNFKWLFKFVLLRLCTTRY